MFRPLTLEITNPEPAGAAPRALPEGSVTDRVGRTPGKVRKVRAGWNPLHPPLVPPLSPAALPPVRLLLRTFYLCFPLLSFAQICPAAQALPFLMSDDDEDASSTSSEAEAITRADVEAAVDRGNATCHTLDDIISRLRLEQERLQ